MTYREAILTIIKENPGLSRQEIFVKLDDPDISRQELTNCLTTLRRQGRTENRGTRKNPHWYKTDQDASTPEVKSKDELMEVCRQSDERLRRSLEHISRRKG